MRLKNKTKWTLLFTLLAVLTLSVFAFAEEAAQDGRVIVLYEDAADPAELEAAIARIEGAELLWRYDTFLSGAAVDAGPQALASLRALPGVAEVRPARSYDAPLSLSQKAAAPANDNGMALMGADKLWEQGYTGDGTVIAVLDTGLLTSHEAFADDSLMSAPAISRTDVEDYAAKGHTAGRYVSKRIPFAYDYYDRDDNVSTTNGHGTHVTALAAGYALDGDGSVRFRGSAPGAQILSMKIFPNGAVSRTDDAIVLRALEDAWNLGADVVNISVSTGAGFAQDQALDGVYCRAFAQMAESGVIICCAAGNENTASASKSWQPHLPTAAYTDYGSNCAPSSYRGSVAIGAASRDKSTGAAVPAAYSSWGPASGLHLTPALLAFGGPSLSANVSGTDLYRSDYGTSMASPSASGLFASLLQLLRERGVTDRVEASRLAQGLLESTAQVLKDSSGVPVSPRKQGAGLADLSAAAASDLAVLDPLVELGESENGKFTLSFTLRNLSKKSITASLSATTLTDGYEQVDGVCYSTLTARDISSGVTVGGNKSVTVPAGGEKEVTLTLTVGEALRKELAPVFTNGFYVEGFVTVSGGNRPVHAAFLGYCGDWEAAPVLETLDFRDVQDAWARMAEQSKNNTNLENVNWYLSELQADMGANLAFIAGSNSSQLEDGRLLGVNLYAYAPHDDARFAMSSKGSNASVTVGSRLCLDLYALRNAAGIVMLVSDQQTGTLYYVEDRTWLERSTVNNYGDGMTPAASFSWEGTDASGKPLPGGTKVRVDVFAWLDTDTDAVAAYNSSHSRGSVSEYSWLLEEAYAGYRELSFPLTLDGQAPTVSAALGGDGKSLTLTIQDDQYLAYAAVADQRRTLLAEEVCFPKAAGEGTVVTVHFPDGKYPDALYIQAEDYAGNTEGYALDVKALAAGKAAVPQPCALLLLRDSDLSGWYHDAVDYVLDHDIMDTDSEMRFRPEEMALRSEIVKALYQASGSPASKLAVSDLPFKDVSSRASYARAVCWAYENKVVNGQTETAFAGNDGVSRQQFAVMLWRCAKLNNSLGSASGSLSAFPDRGSVAAWAQEAMTWAVGRGIIGGQDGKLNPDGPVTRAQAAQMLARYLQR
ncbi:MAG: S8 family serine peptidase [Oscillospiraceae bacterium]|nr:S8 family serine peptidase [Oscillospiraceae bacterium]